MRLETTFRSRHRRHHLQIRRNRPAATVTFTPIIRHGRGNGDLPPPLLDAPQCVASLCGAVRARERRRRRQRRQRAARWPYGGESVKKRLSADQVAFLRRVASTDAPESAACGARLRPRSPSSRTAAGEGRRASAAQLCRRRRAAARVGAASTDGTPPHYCSLRRLLCARAHAEPGLAVSMRSGRQNEREHQASRGERRLCLVFLFDVMMNLKRQTRT